MSKMYANPIDLLAWFLPLVLTTNVCFCYSGNFSFSAIDIKRILRNEFYIIRNNETNSTQFNRTTEYQNCLKELDEIASGFTSDEQWAVKCMCLNPNKLN